MRDGGNADGWKVRSLIDEWLPVLDAESVPDSTMKTPSLVVLKSGRLVLSLNLYGAGLRQQPGQKGRDHKTRHYVQGRIMVSEDAGQTWTLAHCYPFASSRLFRVGHALYVIGHDGCVQLIRSDDGGMTWSKPVQLTSSQDNEARYVSVPGNVFFAGGRIYIPMLKDMSFREKGGEANQWAPVIFSCSEDDSLMQANRWTVSEPGPQFRQWMTFPSEVAGLPHFSGDESVEVGHQRWAHPPGWTDLYLTQIYDRRHQWHHPGRTAMVLMGSVSSQKSNTCAIALVKDIDGSIQFEPLHTPAGVPWKMLSVPGANSRFCVMSDKPTKRYWMVSQMVTDSMRKPNELPADRSGLPVDEKYRVQLICSRNLVDWTFAGLVGEGTYPSDPMEVGDIAVDKGDLWVVVCCGQDKLSAEEENRSRIMIGRLSAFRELA